MTENQTILNPGFALLIGALFALGAAFLGWQAGLGAYSAIYEVLRNSGSEVALESKQTLASVRYGGWLAGATVGGLVFWFWYRSGTLDATGLSAKRLIVLALATVGAVHLCYLLVAGAPVEAMVTTAFLSLVAGSAAAAALFGVRPARLFAARFALAAAAAFVLLWTALAFDKGVAQRYDSVERKRDVWVRVRFPVGAPLPPHDTIKVEMSTPTAIVKGFAIAWEDVSTRAWLPVNFGYTEMTSDRTLIVTMPGRPEIAIKLPFARNPAPMHDYSPWIDLGDGLSYRYRVN